MAVLQRIRDMVLGSGANVDDTIKVEIEDKNGDSRYITGAMLRTMIGVITGTGDVIGSGYVGSIAWTIANDAVTLAKMAHNTANRILGYDASGAPTIISAGSNVTISSGVISMSAPANASPSATILTQRAFGGF